MVPLFKENEFRMNHDDIQSKISHKTKLIIVNSPQNTTGSVMTKNELEEIALLGTAFGPHGEGYLRFS